MVTLIPLCNSPEYENLFCFLKRKSRSWTLTKLKYNAKTHHACWARMRRARWDQVLRRTKRSTTPWRRPSSMVAVERAAVVPDRTCPWREGSKLASKRIECRLPNIARNSSKPDLREVRRRFRMNDDWPRPDSRRRRCACPIRSILIYAILYQIIRSGKWSIIYILLK